MDSDRNFEFRSRLFVRALLMGMFGLACLSSPALSVECIPVPDCAVAFPEVSGSVFARAIVIYNGEDVHRERLSNETPVQDTSAALMGNTADALATIGMEPSPHGAAVADSKVVVFGNAQADADAALTYYLYVKGPPGESVPLTVVASGSASRRVDSPGSTAQAGSSLAVYYDSNPYEGFFLAGTGSTDFFSTVHTEYVPPFQLVEVVIGVYANTFGNAHAGAMVDPYFFVPPDFPDANLYSIVLSPGVGNESPITVPEPPTWAMLLTGFVGLGVAAVRRAASGGSRPPIPGCCRPPVTG